MSSETKRSAWFKWIVGAIIALIGAGGGLVAVLQYLDSKQAAAERQYQQALEEWERFSPQSISRGVQNVELRGGDRFNLETGRVTSAPGPGETWDLMFGCWPQGYESLRALDGVEWFDLGVVDFSAVRYRDIRDARYESRRQPTTGYRDLYYAHKSNVPGKGYAFVVKTTDNNVAKVQIVGYRSVDPNPEVCRDVSLRYEVFPIVHDPPRPRRR
jgi:hypothetical protein